ncbi:TetR/AcrR family transcriptional regulator [Oharaeibacter diazotrophicus]|nr:TetR/AcrR family transcriptional regulator [Oharaeibacter diazotrophicus]BBE71788.1 HTH-type transcriptional regulator EthR [Pleomorphomonas sp. SM30]GLS78553.1 TetR family transcriptional regulator [Oharaeibacter diazotrophicus]
MTTRPPSRLPERRPAGRPPTLPDDERRARIHAAAETLFVEKGYAATSMDDVARACGMSKKTIYRLFDHKQSLFAAIVDEAIDGLPAHDLGEDASRLDGAALLGRVLLDLATMLLHPRRMAIARLVVAEGPQAPELAESLEARGIVRADAVLADALAALHRRGLIAGPVDDELRDILLGAVVGDLAFMVMAGLAAPPAADVLEARVARVLALVGPALFGRSRTRAGGAVRWRVRASRGRAPAPPGSPAPRGS